MAPYRQEVLAAVDVEQDVDPVGRAVLAVRQLPAALLALLRRQRLLLRALRPRARLRKQRLALLLRVDLEVRAVPVVDSAAAVVAALRAVTRVRRITSRYRRIQTGLSP